MKLSALFIALACAIVHVRADDSSGTSVDLVSPVGAEFDANAKSGFPFPSIPVPPWFPKYYLSTNIVGPGFYGHFNWENIADPTHGRVNYVTQTTSIAHNLTYATHDTFILRTDYKTVLDPQGPGRESVRIITKKSFTQHIVIADVRHMPQGCGTWPAIWETKGVDWPTYGEVDIVEGVNDVGPNAGTLHTTQGCTMPASGRNMTGTASQDDCDWRVNWNAGCGVKFPQSASYGPEFNENGGGWFVMERTKTDIKLWFWSRKDRNVPKDVKNRSFDVDPRGWGTPAAHFPNTQCDLEKYFGDNNLIINLTLCGDWAGNVYDSNKCPSTCVDHVNNHPDAFKDAYFDFAGIRIYEPILKN
ncbi:endo-1,3(4)-beta-glucanase-like protein [Panaeolus papilionaceus]|nr:endo-1,3(4)-beta-glucanase-like protein [Panaeolus papilionaceus]